MNKIVALWRNTIRPILKDPLFLKRWAHPYLIEREPNRVSIPVHASAYRWIGFEPELHMFLEDMYVGVMPMFPRRDSQFRIRIEPADRDVEHMISEALDRRGYRHGLSDALSDFVRTTTQYLFACGKAVYEIIDARDESGKITSFEFVSVPPIGVIRFCGLYFQIVPWWVAKRSHCYAGIRRLPLDRIVYMVFPKELGGRRLLRHTLKRLLVLGQELLPKFYVDAMKNKEYLAFDLQRFTRAKYIEQAQVTKQFGWHQRKYSDENILEYYSIYRNQQLALCRAIVRECVVNAINRALNGTLLSLNRRIIMDGIPSSDPIRNDFTTLSCGDVSFSEVYNRTQLS
jgi:hypothetical protein